MRIHGIHVQGLQTPGGEHRLNLDPAYNVVLAPDAQAGAALVALLRAFLFPRTDLGELEIWRAPASGQPARAGLSFSFGSDAFRLIVDLDKQRLVLGRYDAASKSYERVSTDPGEIETCLRGAGLPNRDEFTLLQLCQGPPISTDAEEAPPPAQAATSADQQARERLAQELERALESRREREAVEERVRELREARERITPLVCDYQKLVAELDEHADLGEGSDDLKARLERVQEREAELIRERSSIEQSRRELLDERLALRRIPSRQIFPLWIGIALSVLGTLAGLAGHPLFYVFGPLGVVTMLGALYVSRNAHRRVGTVEACLAALRVRERAVERNFESESGPIRELMQAHNLDTLDGLAKLAEDDQGRKACVAEVEQELSEARRGFSEQVEEELRELEDKLVDWVEAPDPEAVRAALEALPEAVECDVVPRASRGSPDMRIHAAALASGRTTDEIKGRLASSLPVYLRALSLGTFTQARHSDLDGWLLRIEPSEEVIKVTELNDAQRFSVELAFQLALLETIAPDLCVPVIVSPTLPLHDEEEKLALARGLHRLGCAVQVIQVAVGGGAWMEQAQRTTVLE